jgi:hypothetical protein
LSRDFLLGRSEEREHSHFLTGVRFISILNGVEFVGEVTNVTDGIATVENPFILTREKPGSTKLELRKFNTINPLVKSTVQVPITSIIYTFVPEDFIIKNYNAAKSGLVAASSIGSQPN